jgi:RNA polymerase sigma-70 factor (ECF subfamily)
LKKLVAELCPETSYPHQRGRSMSAEEPTRPSNAARRTDSSLLRRIHSGEQEAATALYLRYAERVHALARSKTSNALAARLDPEDIVQSVFRTFFRRASEGHYDIPDGDELWKLLLVISLNKIRTLAGYHRAAKRDVTATVTMEAEAAAPSSSEEESLKILEMIIEETLSDLPEAQREMIRLRIEGHGVAEIADKTQRSKRSVERVLQQFRSRLGRLVLEEPPDHDRSA